MDAYPAFLPDLVAAFEAALEPAIRRADIPDALRDAMAYAALGGGKRIRPALTLLSAELACGRREPALPAAIAIECIHAFSLVHDDLPALDDDDLRRGRPTLHVHTNEATALLAGDALLNHAYDILANAALDSRIVVALTRELTEATRRMIAGQTLDTVGGGPEDDRERLELIHASKTGALIRAACRLGAVAADADDDLLRAVTIYGDRLGLLFQITDDLLDVMQTTEHLGKHANKDADAGKLTFPRVYGVEASQARVADLCDEAVAAVAPRGDAAGPLIQLCRAVANRTR